MLKTLKKVYVLLTPAERIQGYFLFVLSIVLASIQMLGVASILPFMAVATNPKQVHQNRWLKWVYNYFEFSSPYSFLFYLGWMVFGWLVFSNLFEVSVRAYKSYFSREIDHSLSCRLFKNYLTKPYRFFLGRNTSELGKNILNEVTQVTRGIISPAIEIVTKTAVTILIFILLLFVDVWLAITVTAVFGIILGGLFLLIKKKINEMGEKRVKAQEMRYKLADEGLSGIKQLKTLGKEFSFFDQFFKSSQKLVKFDVVRQILSVATNKGLEIIAFGGILLVVLSYIGTDQNFTELMPTLTLYAYAGYRVLPSLRVIFDSFTKLRLNAAALELIYSDFKADELRNSEAHENHHPEERLDFEEKLRLENIFYQYPNTDDYLFENLSLSIPNNTTVGIVGETGSGKTTLIDLILGLLSPDKGTITVDDKTLEGEKVPCWQNSIGYVPQEIFLTDDTVAKNIALGVPEERINREKIRDSARRAHIHDFVTNELEQGYDTVVGENGIRLSGGQRQRIGIARSLYIEPQLLIFDEATSEVDTVTEAMIMDSVYELSDDMTILMIAHRISTVEKCDNIYLLEKGEIIDQGTYEELVGSSQQFRQMVGTSKQT